MKDSSWKITAISVAFLLTLHFQSYQPSLVRNKTGIPYEEKSLAYISQQQLCVFCFLNEKSRNPQNSYRGLGHVSSQGDVFAGLLISNLNSLCWSHFATMSAGNFK